MHDNLRITAKQLAKSTLKQNFWRLMGISLLVLLPSILMSIIFSFMPTGSIDPVTYTYTNISFLNIFAINILQFLFILLLYPLTVGYAIVLNKISIGAENSVNEIFHYYTSLSNIWKSMKIMLYIFFKILLITILVMIRFIVVFIPVLILTFLLTNGSMLAFMSLYIILLVALLLLAPAVYFPISLSNYIMILNINNDSITKREIYRQTKAAFKGRFWHKVVFDLSFFGWGLLTILALIPTFGFSLLVFNTYYTLTYINYAKSTYESLSSSTINTTVIETIETKEIDPREQ